MSIPGPINLAALARQESLAASAAAIGEQVTAEDDMMDMAQDAFNSMAAARAQSRYDRFKTLEDRKSYKSSEAPVEGIKRVHAADQKKEEDLAQSFHQQNDELPVDQLLNLKRSLNEDLSEEQIQQSVEAFFQDPTLADEALSYLEQVTDSTLKQKISRVRQLLNEEKKREIIGGKNITEVAKDFAAKVTGTSPTALRDLYRDVTSTERDHNDLFDLLSRQYPFPQLKELASFLLKSMSYDLKSKGPSIAEPELMRLMKEMRDLQSILWVYLFFQERVKMMRSLYNQYGIPYPEHLDFEKLAKAFMRVVNDRYPSAVKVVKEAEKLGILEETQQVILLSQYRDAIRGLSPRLYQSVKHKQDLLQALIQALEKLETEEEESS